MAAVTPLTVALDWTPNTNHIGFYVVRRCSLAALLALTTRAFFALTRQPAPPPPRRPAPCARVRAAAGQGQGVVR